MKTETRSTPDGAPAPKRKRTRILLLALAAALLCAAAVLGALSARYTLSGGQLYDRRSADLDLRGQAVTAAQYEELTRKLPTCHIRWDIPIGGGRYDSAAKSIAVGDFSVEEAPLFSLFDRLERVDGQGEHSYPGLLAVQALLPDCDVRWSVELGGRDYPQSTVVLELGNDVDYGELAEKLAYLPKLKQLRTEAETLSPEQQQTLMSTYPQVAFLWPVTLCGETFSSGARQLSFAGSTALTKKSLDEMRDNAFRFPRLERLDLTDCGFDSQTLQALSDALPGVMVVWSFDLCGVTVSTTDTFIDLNDIKLEDLSEVEAALPYLPRLQQVDMCECGIPNEDMEALNQRYEGIKFVWMVNVRTYGIRTDSTHFIVYNNTVYRMYDSGVEALKYCHDLIALDLGHLALTDLSFLRYMPHLKYLIFAGCNVSDLTEVGNLKELTWLELFQTPVTDLSPLLGCTALEDLNICYIWAKPDDALEALLQMPWLQRLWYCGNWFTTEQEQELRTALPDCTMFLEKHGESTGGTWRYHEHYFEMRDAFEMYYMDETGHRTTIKRIIEPNY